jgi:ABC-type molybdenum transport system ATPase subunit/photorepair protein PhrA
MGQTGDFEKGHLRRRPQREARRDGAHRRFAALSPGKKGRRRVTAPDDGVLLAVEHVSLSFGSVRAISDVSFDIRKGEIRAIIGPNGAGKTSMLNVVNGLMCPALP